MKNELRGRYPNISGRSVLMVDDEEVVVDVVREVVGDCVEVFDVAVDGIEALEKVMKRDYDFILLDIMMPRMDGMEFYKHLREIKPRLLPQIIFITGDTETESTQTFIRTSGCRFLDKPFMIKDLLEVLDGFAFRPAV